MMAKSEEWIREWKQSTAAKGAEQTSTCIELPLCEKIAAYLQSSIQQWGGERYSPPQTHFSTTTGPYHQTYIQQDEKRRGTKIALTELQISGV